jgi:hypothetical protein
MFVFLLLTVFIRVGGKLIMLKKIFNELINSLIIEDVVLSYIIDDNKNFKGFILNNFQVELIDDSLIITDDNNVEIIYPIEEITNLMFDLTNNNVVFNTSKGEKFELAII